MKKDNHYQKEIVSESNNKTDSAQKTTNMLAAAFMIFIFPLISIFIGVFIGGFMGGYIKASITVSQIIGGIVALAIAVVIIKLYDKSSKADKNAERIYWDDL